MWQRVLEMDDGSCVETYSSLPGPWMDDGVSRPIRLTLQQDGERPIHVEISHETYLQLRAAPRWRQRGLVRWITRTSTVAWATGGVPA